MKLRRITKWFRSLGIARHFVVDVMPFAWRLSAVALFSIVVVAADLLRPWPIQWIFDHALAPVDAAKPRDFEFVVWTGVVALLVLTLVSAILQYFRTVWTAFVGFQVTRGLRHRIFSHLATLAPSFHAKHKSGDLLVRVMGDVPMVSTMMVNSSMELFTRTLLVVGTVSVMFVLDAVLTLVVFIVVPFLLIVVRWISGRIHTAVRKQRKKEGALADYLHEAIAATETIQSLDGTGRVIERFAKNNRRSARAGQKATRLAAGLSAIVESLLGVGFAGALFLGSFRVGSGDLTPGELLVFVSYVRALIRPIRSGSRHAARIAKGTACGERILAVLDEPPAITSAKDAELAPAVPAALEFAGVSYAYGSAIPAVRDLNARFLRGQLSALVGRSGAGKSTVAALAMRLMDPDSGTVSLDGRPLTSLDVPSVRQRVGLCMQRTVLFGDTIRENLLLGVAEATDEAIVRALEAAGARDIVESLPDGLDTALGSGGVGLSGGQASRISLARTVLRDARVLIVDEPFAGLDAIAARHVSQTLRELARDRIVVVIAHDFENLGVFDQIVLIDEGRVVDTGTHEELVSRQPDYCRLVRTSQQVAVAQPPLPSIVR